MLDEHERDAGEDADDEEHVLAGVLVEVHALRLALQLVLDATLAVTVPEVAIFQLLDVAALVVLDDARV